MIAEAIALLVGVALGWFSKRRVWTWCTRCGRHVGRTCLDCHHHDRTHAALSRPGTSR